MKKCAKQSCALGAYGGGLFADDDSYCSNCGGKLVPKEDDHCQCGHRLGDSDKFCSGCGLPREEAVKKETGTKQSRPWICLNCHSAVRADRNHCPRCDPNK